MTKLKEWNRSIIIRWQVCFDSSEIIFEICRFLLLVVNVKIALNEYFFEKSYIDVSRIEANISII